MRQVLGPSGANGLLGEREVNRSLHRVYGVSQRDAQGSLLGGAGEDPLETPNPAREAAG